MLGLMQDWPLLCHRIIEHAAQIHGTQEVVTRSVEGPIHRTNYKEIHDRALKVSQRLDRDGIKLGDRVATIAWNTWRHLEAWYGIMGIGAICHTVNPRLFPEQIAWIINHAQDRALFFDIDLASLVEKLAPLCPGVRAWVALSDSAHAAVAGIPGLLCYEDLLEAGSETFDWPEFDENQAACLCYTSGTTGNPKGALYSHRSIILHSYAAALPDALSISVRDVALPIVPMFHVNAWGIPYIATLVGCKLVLPGPALDGAN
ncbi:MAG: AMP-binding protein, partial [Nevskiales bacterium]